MTSNKHAFGPFSLDLSPRLIIDNLKVEITDSVVQLYGKNGTGKSTLLSLIKTQLKETGQNYSYLNQDYRLNWLWWKSVEQNLNLSYQNSHPGKNFVDSELYKRHRDWLDPILAESSRSVFFESENELSTVQLSGGQLQRVIVLRELLHNPDYLLLDEAFSALDSDITSQIIQMILHEQKEREFTIISIAHSDQVKKLLGGQIITLIRDEQTSLLSLS